MPKLQKPDLLAKAYDATRKKIQSREIPTAFIYAGQFLYRTIDPTSKYSYLPEPTPPHTPATT